MRFLVYKPKHMKTKLHILFLFHIQQFIYLPFSAIFYTVHLCLVSENSSTSNHHNGECPVGFVHVSFIALNKEPSTGIYQRGPLISKWLFLPSGTQLWGSFLLSSFLDASRMLWFTLLSSKSLCGHKESFHVNTIASSGCNHVNSNKKMNKM